MRTEAFFIKYKHNNEDVAFLGCADFGTMVQDLL